MDYKQKYFKYKKKYIYLQKNMIGGLEKELQCSVCKLPTKIYDKDDKMGDCEVQCVKSIINDNLLTSIDLLKDNFKIWNKKTNELQKNKEQEGLWTFTHFLNNNYDEYIYLHLKNNDIIWDTNIFPNEILGWNVNDLDNKIYSKFKLDTFNKPTYNEYDLTTNKQINLYIWYYMIYDTN